MTIETLDGQCVRDFRRREIIHLWLRRQYEEDSISYGTCDGHVLLNCWAPLTHPIFLGGAIALQALLCDSGGISNPVVLVFMFVL